MIAAQLPPIRLSSDVLEVNTETTSRFWAKVQKRPDGCWEWMGARDPQGYGNFGITTPTGPRTLRAHRLAYQLVKGEIPDDLPLDHLCNRPWCVNPHHTKPATLAENILRGNGPSAHRKRQTHCIHGHPFDASNTKLERIGEGRYGRRCLTCRRLYDQRRNLKPERAHRNRKRSER